MSWSQHSLDETEKNYTRDIKISDDIFKKFSWPLIRKHLGGGNLQFPSSDDLELGRLDRCCGVDVRQIMEGGTTRYLAYRSQLGKSYDTFTIRTDRETGTITELEKLSNAIEENCVRPQMHVHTYFAEDAHAVSLASGGWLRMASVSCAVCDTDELVALATEDVGFPQVNGRDYTEFWCVRWADIKSVRIFRAKFELKGSRTTLMECNTDQVAC